MSWKIGKDSGKAFKSIFGHCNELNDSIIKLKIIMDWRWKIKIKRKSVLEKSIFFYLNIRQWKVIVPYSKMQRPSYISFNLNNGLGLYSQRQRFFYQIDLIVARANSKHFQVVFQKWLIFEIQSVSDKLKTGNITVYPHMITLQH